ncbi:MFS transporter [Micromonospora sp. C31]|uniref:MFS transporter n=1 Tax=Micromonospora sp. C31 TaxID=2824876 RepID=UPI001B37ABAE|nr:MFS transporter [Micromonospora sp. C31]MBQ1075044.1 MFS transporter [Micromonospora sp. C31]
MDVNASEAEPRAGRREWIGLAVLTLPTLLLSLDLNVLYLALPHLSADLAPDAAQLLWIMDIYGFMIAGFLVTMGTLGDRIGRRRLLMIGAAAFGVASVIAAYSDSAEMLIATRALLGVAGATLMPSTLSLISNMFRNPQQRTMAIGLWMSCFMIGAIIGPLVGGVILESFWWGAVFLLGVPVMLVLLVAAPLLLPEYRNPDAGRLDLFSVVLSLATILPFVYGLKELAKDGLGIRPLLAMIAGVVVGVIFVARQRRLTSPLLDVRLFANRTFSAALGIMLLGGSTIGGIALLFAQYAQLVEGLSPLRAGLWMLPYAVSMLVGAMLAPVVAQRFAPGYVVAGGMALAAVGFALLSQVGTAGGLGLAVTGLVIVYLGFGPGAVLGTDLIIGAAPPERAGSASSMSETSTELGVALGVAVLGSVGTAVYRSEIAPALPADLPAQVREAAGDSLAGASAMTGQLSEQTGGALLEAARAAFTSGFNVAGVVSAVIAVILAVLSALLLRRVRPAAEEPVVDASAVPADGTDETPASVRH